MKTVVNHSGPRGRGPCRTQTPPPRPCPAAASAAFPLGLLVPGESAEIVSARIGPHAAGGSRLDEMGLRAGRTVEMLANAGGPLLVKVDETRVAIGRGLAMKILVRGRS